MAVKRTTALRRIMVASTGDSGVHEESGKHDGDSEHETFWEASGSDGGSGVGLSVGPLTAPAAGRDRLAAIGPVQP